MIKVINTCTNCMQVNAAFLNVVHALCTIKNGCGLSVGAWQPPQIS